MRKRMGRKEIFIHLNIKPGRSEEERTVFSRNSDRKTGHVH